MRKQKISDQKNVTNEQYYKERAEYWTEACTESHILLKTITRKILESPYKTFFQERQRKDCSHGYQWIDAAKCIHCGAKFYAGMDEKHNEDCVYELCKQYKEKVSDKDIL